MKSNFIQTSDEATAKQLRELGFQELPKQNGRWMFINSDKIVFSKDDMKIQYTNMLTF